MKQHAKWPSNLLSLFYFITVLLLSFLNYWFVIGPYGVEKFDVDTWFTKQTNETDTYCFRGHLANDVNNRLIKEGASKQDIINMLGQPDINEQNIMDYSLGFCSPMDYNSVVIFFDNSGKVKNATNVQH